MSDHDHDAHIRAQRAAWYVALRSGLDARGSLPPVDPWADDEDTTSRVQPGARQIGLSESWWHTANDRWKKLERLWIPPAPTTGSQWCGVLHPDAPGDCVVRFVADWLYFGGNRVHVTDATNGNVSRSPSPATPASIPHARDDGRVDWRDDPHQVWLGAHPRTGSYLLHRARLLGGTAAGDPPSPWWEGDGRGRREAE